MVRKLISQQKLSSISDEELIRRFSIHQDPIIAEALFTRFMHLVFGVCFKYLKDEEKAKDAAMNVFEKLLIKPPDQDIRNFKNWLFTVSKNHCLILLRRGKTELRYRTDRVAELDAELTGTRKDRKASDRLRVVR